MENGSAVGTGDLHTLDCGLIVACIGYSSTPIADVPFDDTKGVFLNESGRIADRLYVSGWARRGPSGTIGTNKPDGASVAERIAAEVTARGRTGGLGLDSLLASRGIRPVMFSGWQAIDAAETAAATHPAPREKIVGRDRLRATAHGS